MAKCDLPTSNVANLCVGSHKNKRVSVFANKYYAFYGLAIAFICTLVSAKDSSDISTNEDSDKYLSEYELASSSDTWLHPWSFDRNISSESSPHQPEVDTVGSILP